MAILADVGASLLVITNGMRLLRAPAATGGSAPLCGPDATKTPASTAAPEPVTNNTLPARLPSWGEAFSGKSIMTQNAFRTLVPARNKVVAFFVFVREWARSPRSIGMVCPSGPILAQAMAENVPLPEARPDGTFDVVVELGAGTGTVTHELLRCGINPQRLLVLERAEGMVELLRLRFPGLRIVHGDAAQLSRYIPAQAHVTCIVSSLPLVSLPDEVRKSIIAEMAAVLGTGLLIQYTYSLGRHFILMREGFRCIRSRRIWRNLPPAKVLVLTSNAPTASEDSGPHAPAAKARP